MSNCLIVICVFLLTIFLYWHCFEKLIRLTKIAFNTYSRGTRARARLVSPWCGVVYVCCQKWVSEKFENFTGRLLSTGLNHPYDKSCAFRVACTLGFVKNTKNAVWACFQATNPTSSSRMWGYPYAKKNYFQKPLNLVYGAPTCHFIHF